MRHIEVGRCQKRGSHGSSVCGIGSESMDVRRLFRGLSKQNQRTQQMQRRHRERNRILAVLFSRDATYMGNVVKIVDIGVGFYWLRSTFSLGKGFSNQLGDTSLRAKKLLVVDAPCDVGYSLFVGQVALVSIHGEDFERRVI